MNTTAPTVEIPAAVRDNSETVTDYAHMGHRAPDKGVRTPFQREADVVNATFFGYQVYTWRDVNPDGQRCAFTMIVKEDGSVRHLFHTEYFTRVACAAGEWCHSYATYYVRQDDPREPVEEAHPYCDEHTTRIIGAPLVMGQTNYVTAEGDLVRLSERLLIGQHD